MTKNLVWPAYLVGALLVVISLLDWAASVWPFELSSVNWRYGSYGLLSGYLLTPLLGAFLIMVTAALQATRTTQRVNGVLLLAAATILAIALVAFLFDVLQIRSGVPEESRGVFDFGVFKALLKHAMTLIVLTIMGVAGLRAPHFIDRRRAGGASPDSPLVMRRAQGEGR